MKKFFSNAALGLAFTLLAAVHPSPAQDLAAFEKAVTEFTLENGLHFLVLERHDAPVVSFHTFVDVGSVDDPKGRTGLAHMFEHMAFKGTRKIGTDNYEKERQALEEVEKAYAALEGEKRKGRRASRQALDQLEEKFDQAVEAASELADSEEFTRLIEENGGNGLNASTSWDATRYFYSLPSNRTELWFYLESERFLQPVYRDFYKERNVVHEERRMRTDSNPVGKLIEAFVAAAYEAHPYGWPTVGWSSDIQSLGVSDAERFFQTYYVPSNMVVAIVGDVETGKMRQFAEAYFGRLPKRPLPPAVSTVEPAQEGERRIEIISPSQPVVVIGFKKPAKDHPDRAVFDVISSVLSEGRTSWFYKELVRDRQIALDAGGFPDYPGNKYPSLFLFYAFPTAGHTVQENEKAMYELIEKLKTEAPDAETLQMVKTKARASLLSTLDSNAALADKLTEFQVGYGDWRQMFRWLDEMEKVSAEDVTRVAKAYFQTEARTVAYLVPPPAGDKEVAK